MKLTTLMRCSAVTVAAFLTIGAGENWIQAVSQTEGGHEIGNSDAEVKLTEFVSYTCPACARFVKEGEGALQLVYIGSGRMQLEIRPVIRNVVDLTATMLVQCGDADKFLINHALFMNSQGDWLAKALDATPGQKQRWNGGDAPSRRAIASDLDFYTLMEVRGYRRTDVDRCLNDDTEATRIAANSVADRTEFGVTSTPSFAIDGVTLLATSGWSSLQPQLDARF